MVSVIVLFRNAPRLAERCLVSLLACRDTFAAAGGAELLLFDDHSDAEHAVLPLLLDFHSAAAPSEVQVLRFARQMHYAHGLAYALSEARGESVLFISHDMMLAPACAEELIAVAASDSNIGIVRPVSPHMDWARSFVVPPPVESPTLADVQRFSAEVRERAAGQFADWPMLIGDAMLVRRAVIDRIGVFDTRFFGFMADVDYGLRATRAGFRHGIAKGAWLHHEGNGTSKEVAATGGPSVPDAGREMVAQARAAYDLFRQKWDITLPENFKDLRRQHFEQLHALPPHAGDAYQPPLSVTSEVADRL